MEPMICRAKSTGETTRVKHYIKVGDTFLPDYGEIGKRLKEDFPKVAQLVSQNINRIANRMREVAMSLNASDMQPESEESG